MSGSGHYHAGDEIDRWRILGELGQGGLGVVYDAEHTFTGKRGALKVIKGGTGKQAEVLANKMHHEAKLLSRLKHPHLVEVYDAGLDDNGQIWMVMERLQGRDLEEVLRIEGKLGLGRALRYAEAVASATAVVHGAGVIHRDLKPDNVHISDRDEVKVIDFGTARYRQGATMEGQAVGTIPYMSPEHLRGGELDGRTDVFALGFVLYEMLAGHHPFAVVGADGARGWPETREMIGMMFHRPLPSLEPQVGPEVWALIDRATQRKREHRFADMAALAAALQQLRGPMAQTYAPTQRLSSADVAAGAASGRAFAGASGSGSGEGSGLDATAAMLPAMAAQLGAATSSAAVTRDPSPREPKRLSMGVVLGVFGAVALLTAVLVATVAGGSDETASSAEPALSTESLATETAEEPEPADPSEDVSAEPTEEEPPAAPTATASASAAAATPPATPARPTPRPVPVPRPQTKPPSGMDW
ncbi:MAG: serine/threonine-protein kinase [Polyangiaceae bacterium]